MEDGKLITAKHNADGSSSVGLLSGKLGETRGNEKTSGKTASSKAAGSSRPLHCKYAALAHLSKDPTPTRYRNPCSYHNRAPFTLHFAVTPRTIS